MRGDTVIVRAFRGEPLVRRVWGAAPEAVYICSEERFQRLWRGEREWPATGFPREDVFKYEASLFAELTEHWQDNPSLWDRATPWTGDEDDDGQTDEEPTHQAA